MFSAPSEGVGKTSNDHIGAHTQRGTNVLHCLVAAACVSIKAEVNTTIIHGASTTAAGTLGSAELSIQQAIRSPTATANGNDRQTLF
jgi:hypothetical protein